MSLSLESLAGVPAQHQVDPLQSALPSSLSSCPNETQPQVKFAGVGLARPLSQELWVIDGGKSWGVGTSYPVQWILLDTENITQQAPMHIQVFGQYTDSKQAIPLVDGSMKLLSSDVATGLLSGNTTPPTMYSFSTTVLLAKPACVAIRAVVTREGIFTSLYDGNILISAR